MGGLGKSSVAVRLCERMSGYLRLVWVGRIDEIEFLRVINDKLENSEARKILNDGGTPLKMRLQIALRGPLAGAPILFVFDDFEQQNFDLAADNSRIMQAKPADVITALLAAIREANSESRVIITSRYRFPLPDQLRLHEEGLESFRGADLEKKCEFLPSFYAGASIDPVLRERALEIAAGNPRLLERIDKILADERTDHASILSAMEAKAAEFRETILLDELLHQQDRSCRRLLAKIAVFDLPVRQGAVEVVAGGDPVNPHLERAVSLGLAESGIDPATKERRYFVSGIVRPLINEELTDDERLEACRDGVRHLYQVIWVNREFRSLDELYEIHRLALDAREEGIALEIGDYIAGVLYKYARYREAENVCRETLNFIEDDRILHILARVEAVLGKTDQAQQHFKMALDLIPFSNMDRDPEIAIKYSSIIHDMAGVYAQQGEVEQALELWKQSLEIEERTVTPGGRPPRCTKWPGCTPSRARWSKRWNCGSSPWRSRSGSAMPGGRPPRCIIWPGCTPGRARWSRRSNYLASP
jgi:tetratricopeptide (TPR) repeat protein